MEINLNDTLVSQDEQQVQDDLELVQAKNIYLFKWRSASPLVLRPIEFYCLLDSRWLEITHELEAISLYAHYVLNIPYYFNMRRCFLSCLRHQNVTKLIWALAVCRGKLKHEEASLILKRNIVHSLKRDSIQLDFTNITKRDVFANVAKYILSPE